MCELAFHHGVNGLIISGSMFETAGDVYLFLGYSLLRYLQDAPLQFLQELQGSILSSGNVQQLNSIHLLNFPASWSLPSIVWSVPLSRSWSWILSCKTKWVSFITIDSVGCFLLSASSCSKCDGCTLCNCSLYLSWVQLLTVFSHWWQAIEVVQAIWSCILDCILWNDPSRSYALVLWSVCILCDRFVSCIYFPSFLWTF